MTNLQADNIDFTTAPENLAPVIAATIKVSIRDSGQTACVRISPPSNGGDNISMDTLMKALLNENGIKNVNLMTLKGLVANTTYDEDIVVAVGTAPINGEDGTVEFKVRIQTIGRPMEVEDGRVDYYDLGLIQNVKAGQVLCVITPPSLGTPGYNVKGEALRAKPGKSVNVSPGINTVLSSDGTQIISKINGQFEFLGKRLNVNETYTVNQNVDTSTGNIKVEGNLIIRGMVTSGFTLEAGGFINVVGVVDSSTVIAGKDLILQGGSNGSTLRCGGNLKSRFIENCDVSVRGEMRTEYILNCNVRCKKNLRTEGAISKIIGGTCIVMQNVEARTIGSVSGVKTKLEIGVDPEIIDRQHALTAQIPELEKQIKSLEPLLKLLDQLKTTNRLDPEKQEMLDKATFSYNAQTELLENARIELEEINGSLINKSYGKVLCTGIIYPGTTVTIGSANYTVTQNLVNASLFYHEGGIALGSAK